MLYIPEPDVVYKPSESLENQLFFNALPSKAIHALEALSLDKEITDVVFRLKEAFIFDVRDIGKGDIYFITVVTDNLSEEPITLSVKTFEDIKDNEGLQFGPAGLTIYRNPSGKIPRFLDYRILVMESDEELQDAGNLISEITGSEQFKTVKDSLIGIAVNANPTAALISTAADLVIGLISQVLKMNKDDQIIYILGSFNDKIDNLGVDYGEIKNKNRYARISYQVEAA